MASSLAKFSCCSKRPTVAVFADGQNVCLKTHGSAIIEFVYSLGEASFVYAYHHWRSFPEKIEHLLQLQGWQCVDVATKKKNELDSRLINDFHRLSNHWMPEVVVLVTGDKDFTPLIKACIAAGRQPIVIGRRDNVSQRLKRLIPNNVYFVEDLHSHCLSTP